MNREEQLEAENAALRLQCTRERQTAFEWKERAEERRVDYEVARSKVARLELDLESALARVSFAERLLRTGLPGGFTSKVTLPSLRFAMGMRKTLRSIQPHGWIDWSTVRWHGPENEWKWEHVRESQRPTKIPGALA